jgi:3-oxoacyl-(acyl-carrier-protein) synthase
MDEYMRERARMVEEGRRSGRSLSLAWPLWADGGMRPAGSNQSEAEKSLSTEVGMNAFYQACATTESNVIVTLDAAHQPAARPAPRERRVADDQWLRSRTLHKLTQLFADVSAMPIARLNAREPLEAYGLDSLMVLRLNRKLDEHFSGLAKTVFFEYPTLDRLSEHLALEHAHECAQWCGIAELVAVDVTPPDHVRPVIANHNAASVGSHAREAIAIIGLSGRYPQARSVAEFWENLAAGKDCITEIPRDRWTLEATHCDSVRQAVAERKSYCKWGGFLEGFSEFDPLFFHIAPREAEGIDPQERLFLQSCWEVLEDAGYTRELVATRHASRLGVFAGITKTGFELHAPALNQQGAHAIPKTSFGSLANRVSYFLDARGPSMPIDTMCSSSLTAIHQACESLLRDECELAIAGGVNLYLHPTNYAAMCALQMLSASGRSRSFGAGADGMVPGEGVGTVLLKRLSSAERDRDNIYAVIRGTSINHGGKTNGYTVPNPQAQCELIRSALRAADVDARAISYIEAHGTGTELGDPIEIAGLSQAFGTYTSDRQFCAIGSAKSNVGHLEAAAGMAGLTKVLLQMKHRTLVPSLHASELNPHIDFARTPFVVQRELGEWRRPMLTVAGETREQPRIAGISSFGAGGANAHVIVQEYERVDVERKSAPLRPSIIVLSAKDEEGLQARVMRLAEHLSHEAWDDAVLEDIAYTLHLGREPMEHRVALLASSITDLREKLTALLSGEERAGEIFRGDTKAERESLLTLSADEDTAGLISVWMKKRKYDRLADLWVKGLTFDWDALYEGRKPHRISLPTYPFARETYWIATETDSSVNALDDTVVLLKSPRQFDSPATTLSPVQEPPHTRWVVLVGGDAQALDSGEQLIDWLGQQLPAAHCLRLQPIAQGLEQRFTEYAVQLLECVRQIIAGRPRQPVLIQLVICEAEHDEHRVLRGLGALLKTAQLENPLLSHQVIELHGSDSPGALLQRLQSDAACVGDREIRYEDGRRWIVGLEEVG